MELVQAGERNKVQNKNNEQTWSPNNFGEASLIRELRRDPFPCPLALDAYESDSPKFSPTTLPQSDFLYALI